MNFWQIVMLMAWLAVFAVFVWALVSMFIDVIGRDDVSGVATVAWIVFVLFVPVVGLLVYVAMRPKLSRAERRDAEAYEAALVPNATVAAEQVAELARLHVEGAISDDEYETLKAEVIG